MNFYLRNQFFTCMRKLKPIKKRETALASNSRLNIHHCQKYNANLIPSTCLTWKLGLCDCWRAPLGSKLWLLNFSTVAQLENDRYHPAKRTKTGVLWRGLSRAPRMSSALEIWILELDIRKISWPERNPILFSENEKKLYQMPITPVYWSDNLNQAALRSIDLLLVYYSFEYWYLDSLIRWIPQDNSTRAIIWRVFVTSSSKRKKAKSLTTKSEEFSNLTIILSRPFLCDEICIWTYLS